MSLTTTEDFHPSRCVLSDRPETAIVFSDSSGDVSMLAMRTL